MDLDGQILAPAERAAHAGEVDPHHVGRKVEARRDLVAVDVEPLRRDVNVDAALPVRDRDARLRAEERLVLLADVVDPRHRDVALDVRVAAPNHDRANDVRPRVVAVAVAHRRAVGMERLGLGRSLGIGDRLELLVLDPDGRGSAPGLLGLFRRHNGDGFPEVANTLGGQHGLILELEPVRLLAGNVLLREHRVDSRHANRLGDVDGHDPRVRVRAADGVAPEHPGDLEVARVRERTRHLGDGVVPASPDLGPAVPNAGGSAHRPAASCTASRIFW